MQGPTLALDDDHIPIGAAVQLNGVGQPEPLQPLATTLPVGEHDDPVHDQVADGGQGDAEPKSQFWNNNDFGATSMNAPTGSFVSDVYITKEKATPRSTTIVGVIVSLVACVLILNQVTGGPSPLESVIGFWHSFMGDGVETNVVAMHKAKNDDPNSSEVDEQADEVPSHSLVKPNQTFDNPYQNLKNKITEKTLKKSEKLHAAQENEWRSGLESPYYYQRYKTVLDVVAAHKFGSESILRDALQSGKFWMRMRAVMGLADMGYIVTPEDIKTALGDGHKELRARFFMRFEKGDCGPGCFFVARGALVDLTPDGRLQALRVLQRDMSATTASYMVAATFDRDARVRQLASDWLLENPVEESEWWRVYGLISQNPGSSANALPAAAIAHGPATQG